MIAKNFRLRKHADYQAVYKAGRKQFARQMAYFFTLRTAAPGAREDLAPRVGLTVGKVMGKAVDRNRIKRRLRAAIRTHLPLLSSPVDVILHPRRTVLTIDFPTLDREVATIFRTVQKLADKQQSPSPAATSQLKK